MIRVMAFEGLMIKIVCLLVIVVNEKGVLLLGGFIIVHVCKIYKEYSEKRIMFVDILITKDISVLIIDGIKLSI